MFTSGLLCLYKPKGWTSSDCVVKIRNILQAAMRKKSGKKKEKIKVGHGGTLDPMAEGVLVLGVGKGTKMMGKYLQGFKEYRADAILGSETDTLDSSGTTTITSSCSHVTMAQLGTALPAFTGHIMQVPPMYSALSQNGKRLYKLARAGEVVDRPPRQVEVKKLCLLGSEDQTSGLELPAFTLEMETSGGFYVRSLISDLGRSCGTHAHMTGLVRLKQGPFSLRHCLSEKDWTAEQIEEHVQRCNEVLRKDFSDDGDGSGG